MSEPQILVLVLITVSAVKCRNMAALLLQKSDYCNRRKGRSAVCSFSMTLQKPHHTTC